jgi:hypothetical protein
LICTATAPRPPPGGDDERTHENELIVVVVVVLLLLLVAAVAVDVGLMGLLLRLDDAEGGCLVGSNRS